jgi:hypothetical protein
MFFSSFQNRKSLRNIVQPNGVVGRPKAVESVQLLVCGSIWLCFNVTGSVLSEKTFGEIETGMTPRIYQIVPACEHLCSSQGPFHPCLYLSLTGLVLHQMFLSTSTVSLIGIRCDVQSSIDFFAVFPLSKPLQGDQRFALRLMGFLSSFEHGLDCQVPS